MSDELFDPNPNIRDLFMQFNLQYFYNRLNSVEVTWSKRMTLCAGLCQYHGRRSGYCVIRLSEPLLKFRPRSDLVETLLHEMIHAYLFVTAFSRDRDGHGPDFCSHMRRINAAAGTNITIYHSFHNEVSHYKKHVWRCDGICKSRHPFYGYVRRSMNRAPGPSDNWHREHQLTCGGNFHKIAAPEGFIDKKQSKHSIKSKIKSSDNSQSKLLFPGVGRTLSSSSKSAATASSSQNLSHSSVSDDVIEISPAYVNCPSCSIKILFTDVNSHLDQCCI